MQINNAIVSSVAGYPVKRAPVSSESGRFARLPVVLENTPDDAAPADDALSSDKSLSTTGVVSPVDALQNSARRFNNSAGRYQAQLQQARMDRGISAYREQQVQPEREYAASVLAGLDVYA